MKAKQKIDSFKVVLVEDETLIINSLERHIHSIDPSFEIVAKCSNGQEALSYLKNNSAHLVITDIMMPVMDGLSLAKKIQEGYPSMLTIILTGYADFNYARDALKSDVFDYLLKPVNPQELSDSLNKARIHLETYYTLTEESHITGKDSATIVEYVKLYIMENYMNEVDFTSLASTLGFSSAYLTKIFTKCTNETPVRYLTAIRIREAKRLLIDTSLPIQKVGELVGYPDQFYFSKTFRKATDKNPSTYRREKKED
ncbi:MAG TPA: response regulator [Candidatus Dorea intestinavium]|nr:response regulator [Candidatus Dorea intestinavium]